MGGTFNPPHIGHFIIAETVRQEMSLDKIIFIPTGRIGDIRTRPTSQARRIDAVCLIW